MSDQKRKNPALSEVALSKRMDIPPTTFNRLVNGYSQPNITTFAKLIKHVPALKNCLPEEIRNTFKAILESKEVQDYLPIGNNGQGTISNFKNGVDKQRFLEKQCAHRELQTLLSDRYIFLCYALACLKRRVTKEEIQNYFGQKGLKALDILVKKNLLLQEDNYFCSIQPNYYEVSFHLNKKHLKFLAEIYDPDDVQCNYINVNMECLNKKGRDKLIKAHVEFHKKIIAIMNDKTYKGDQPVFSIACSDFLVKPMIEDKKVAIKEKLETN